MSYGINWANLGPISLWGYFFYFWANLRPIQVELIVEHIIPPKCCKAQILEDLTNIVIISLTIAL